MRRSLGVLLASFWIRFGIRVARKSQKRFILRPLLTTFKVFEFVAFTNTPYFTAFLTTVGLLQSSSSLRVSRTLMTQPSWTHCNLHTFLLLPGPANSSRNSSDKPFPHQGNHENTKCLYVFWILSGSLDSFRKVFFDPLASRSNSLSPH